MREFMTQARATKRRTSLEKHREEVIALLLTGWNQEQVAVKYKVNPSSVHRFADRHADKLTALQEIVAKQTEDYAIAVKVNRIAALDERWQRMKALITARATDTRYADEPGYETGLMVHQLKAVGKGDDFQLVDLYVTDSGLLAEMRATEHAAAEELAQIPRPDQNVNLRAQVLVRQYVGFDPLQA